MPPEVDNLTGERVDAAIAEYLEAVKNGSAPDLDTFVARHVEIADELKEFLNDYQAFDGAARKFAAGVSTDGKAHSTEYTASARRVPLTGSKRFGYFELLEEVARGGMGVVYKARQSTPSRIVALKMILAGQFASTADVERFYAEAHAAAALDHPNIVPIFEVGEHEGQHYFTMAFVEGQSLGQRLLDGPLPAREAAQIVRDVARAVEYAHRHGVIHRDLKPANILQEADGRVRVTDFGLAKRQTDDSGLTRTGELLGTPSFMSPEQVSGEPARIGPASDVYSLGATLYTLLTGRPPFQAASTVDTLKQVLDQEPVAPRDLDSTIPRDLETVVLKCLEKDPNRRYESAAVLGDDIVRFLADEPVLARPATRLYRAKKFVRRNKAAVFATAAVFAALVAGVIGTSIGLVGQSRQRAIAEEQRGEAKRQASAAIREAARAEAVNRFLVEMLASAQPAKLGENATILDAINASIAELDSGELRDQPWLEASVRRAIGAALQGLGQYEEALAHFRRSLELFRRTQPPRHPDIAWGLNDVAGALASLDRLDEAERLHREALAILRDALPAGDANIATIVNDLAELLAKKGEYVKAELLEREALEISRNASPPDPSVVIVESIGLASLLTTQGKMTEAEQLLREKLGTCRRSLTPRHLHTAKCLNGLAMLLDDRGDYWEAEQSYREALTILRDVLPAGHRDIGVCASNFALVLQKQDKFTEAEPLFREAVEVVRASLPPGHLDIAGSLNNLGVCLIEQKKLSEAEPLVREVCEIVGKTLPPKHPHVAICEINLGRLLESQGKLDEAEGHFRNALVGLESSFGKQHGHVAEARLRLGVLLTKLNRFPDAESELLEARRVFAAVEGASPGLQEPAISALAFLYAAWDKVEPGKQYDAQAKQWRNKLLGNQPPPDDSAPPKSGATQCKVEVPDGSSNSTN